MKKLKILGICGSPRSGNSEFLLRKAIEAAKENCVDEVVENYYFFKGKKFAPCLDCSGCLKGECVIKDDFQQLRDLWVDADVIIYSVPVYHMGMPGQLKCFLDRLGQSMAGKYAGMYPAGEERIPKFMKVIGNIVQGAHMTSGQEHTLTELINHAIVMQCIPVPGDIWESYIGCGGWTANDAARNALETQVEKDEFCAQVTLKASKDMGKRSVQMAQIIRDGVLARKDLLEKDYSYKYIIDKLTEKDV